MSCPDWNHLDADAPLATALRQHADGCRRCRREALRRDPTLAFRRLPSVPVGAADIEAMKAAVAAMRRGNAVQSHESVAMPDGTSSKAPTIADHRHTWSVLLRAAVLITAVLGAAIGVWAPWQHGADPVAGAQVAQSAGAQRVDETTGRASIAMAADREAVRRALLENVKAFDEVIQMTYDDLDLVVVIDSNLEANNLDV